ncbi:hypothetical protein J2Z43_001532 [Clostridioides mangenotii]|uniref:Uncharacterized protein n=1 Tax=Metaclostridioides mangenotii TaxID=1540 RepID=A0ABS4EB36_9FIRM|nr:hypothetical protein [Clostridioides mangenotii]
MKGILKKWKSKNICTYNQLEAYETFTKYSEDELGEIIRKSQKSKFG